MGAPHTDRRLRPRGRVPAVGFVLGLSLSTSCFDSDQRFSLTGAATTGGQTTVTSGPPSPWTTGQGASSTGGEPPVPESTCRDAVMCVFGCSATLEFPLPPEPDLSCFLQCEDGLTEEEALLLLRLLDCVAAQCAEKGLCDAGTTGGASSGGATGDTGTGGSSGGAGLDPCTNCILVNVQDPQPPGCLEEAAMCD